MRERERVRQMGSLADSRGTGRREGVAESLLLVCSVREAQCEDDECWQRMRLLAASAAGTQREFSISFG